MAHYEAPAAFSSSAIRIVTAGGVQDLVPGSSYFDVEMTATTLRMPSGVYYIENDLKLHASSVLEVVPDADDNPVVIYLGDDLEVFDSTINLDGLPRNVQIYFTSDNRDQTLLTQRNSQAWMVCSGHDVVAIMENSHLYGAIQADELTFSNGSQVHYDTSIENQKLDGEAVWSLEGVREGAVD